MKNETIKAVDADLDLDLSIEEVSTSTHHLDDCLSTASSFSCSVATAASFSSVGSVASCGS